MSETGPSAPGPRQGDLRSERAGEEGFGELFARFAPQVLGYFARRGVPDTDRERLTEQVVAALWVKAREQDLKRAPLAAWAFALTRDTYLRACQNQLRPEPDPGDPCFVGCASSSATSRRGPELASALEALPDPQRDLLRALYCDGMTLTQLASASGQPLGEIQAQARLALQALRTQSTEGPA